MIKNVIRLFRHRTISAVLCGKNKYYFKEKSFFRDFTTYSEKKITFCGLESAKLDI